MRSMMTKAAQESAIAWAASGHLKHAFRSAEGPYCDICTGEQDGIQHPLDPTVIATEKFLIQRRVSEQTGWRTQAEAAGKVGAERRLKRLRELNPKVKWRIVRATTTYTVVTQDELEVPDADPKRPAEGG